MWSRRVAWVAAAFLFGLALIGCAAIPTAELRDYAAAFQESRAAGYILLDKISPIIAKRQQGTKQAAACPKDRTGTPRCFNPKLVGPSGRPPEPTVIIVRRAALDLVAVYNSVLVDLAEGKSEAEVQSRVGEVVDFASEMIGLIGVGGAGLPVLVGTLRGPLLALIGRIEQQRAVLATRQAVLEGRETVKAILSALAAETPTYYELYRAQRLQDIVPLRTSGNQAGQQAILDDINAYYASLTSYVLILQKTSKALDTLAAAVERGGQPTPENIREVIKEAIELRQEAKTFWETVRKARDTLG